MKISFMTLGCRTNQAESDHLMHLISAAGHHASRKINDPAIVIINSCCVTKKAEQQSRQLISRALNSKAKVIVTGCYAELKMGHIKGNGQLQIVLNRDKCNIINMIPEAISTNASVERLPRQRPIVKVQDGCNNSCSYCIIPTVRGRSVSIPVDNIIDEIHYYESLGVKEIVLSGIHLGNYGIDLQPSIRITDLLSVVLSKSSVPRIRLSSMELGEITDVILDMIADGRICNHLHLPLQGGTDKTLGDMNRNYTIRGFISGIEHIRKKISDITIGSDIMVGFPGETDDEFDKSMKNVVLMDFSYIHVFPFSCRPGTPACNFHAQVGDFIKKGRTTLMLQIGRSLHGNFLNKSIGTYQDIVVEVLTDKYTYGTTSSYLKVRIPADETAVLGNLMKIAIVGVDGSIALGVPVNGM